MVLVNVKIFGGKCEVFVILDILFIINVFLKGYENF